MKKTGLILLLLALTLGTTLARGRNIQQMIWGQDYKLHVKLSNDSSYVMDVRGLYHQGDAAAPIDTENTTYLPVALDADFIRMVKEKPLKDSLAAASTSDSLASRKRNSTLWAALHHEIGGGYVHLVNCIMYALESRQLNLANPIMLRPKTSWKPDPMTESYRRTRRWEHYVPLKQKLARREYKYRKRDGQLTDLQGVPKSFIDLFEDTSDRGYRKLQSERKQTQMAQIDLVRIMLAARYLGEKQIAYISDCVRNAITRYTASNLPSVIILDDFKAAVAMRLDTAGYRVDHIVFENQKKLPPEEVQKRTAAINRLVANINEANNRLFLRRLNSYYQKPKPQK
ncbi:MAG: hypothetical protein CSA97_03265 [Bacteroidetes bacterium]|nr:MAG: hypothetical protein CSA97_03265 [Bacteroidota bacterium]